MKNRLFLLSGVFLFTLTTSAETVQKVTVDGEEVGKYVTLIAFDGDCLHLSYEDGTTADADMNEVRIDFLTVDAIRPVVGKADADRTSVYNLQGQYVGKSLQGQKRGIYIVKGKKYTRK